HDAARHIVKGYDAERLPLRSLTECVGIYEDAAAWRHPRGRARARVVAVALNTSGLAEDAAREAVRSAEAETPLPAADPTRGGHAAADLLARALLGARVPVAR